MTLLFALLIRILIIFIIVQIVLKVFFPDNHNRVHTRGEKKSGPERFNTSGQNVSDGDFKDLT
ncbi:MAG: hypothetical protein ACOCW2_01010 [Chitinivibrionales bacterium]